MTIWDGVDRLIDAAPTLDGLRAHGLHLLAARRWREQGRPIPAALQDEARGMAMADLAAATLLARIRTVLAGPILLIKGPEIAARYPGPGLRPFRDLDLLVPTAAGAQQTLLAAGFVPAGDEQAFADHHHAIPLAWAGLPLLVELHTSFFGPGWMARPSNSELFAGAVPTRTDVSDLLTLPPLYHPVLLAAHSWQHVPLRRVLDLVDIAVMAEGLDEQDLRDVARQLNIGRVWATTIRAIDALLLGGPVDSWPLRLWARHLVAVRRRTTRQERLTRWLGTCWAPTPTAALGAAAAMIRADARRWVRGRMAQT